MSRVVSNGRTEPRTWAAYAAFAWTVAFIAFHVYWFMGGRLGVGDASDPIPGPPSSVVGWMFNITVLAMFASGLMVPLALVRPWGRKIPLQMLLALAWLGCGVLAARGGAGIVDSLLRVAGVLPRGLTGLTYEQTLGQAHPSAYTRWSGAAIDAYFLIGGILFGVAAFGYQRGSRRPGATGELREGKVLEMAKVSSAPTSSGWMKPDQERCGCVTRYLCVWKVPRDCHGCWCPDRCTTH